MIRIDFEKPIFNEWIVAQVKPDGHLETVGLLTRCIDCVHYKGMAECDLIGECGGTDFYCKWADRKDLAGWDEEK